MKGILLGLAFLLGMAGVGIAGNLSSEREAARGRIPLEGQNGLTVPREDGPIAHGARVSLEEAESLARGREGEDFVLFRPDHARANDSNLNGVYYSSGSADVSATGLITQVGLDYESGLIVVVHRADVDFGFADDAETQYEEMVASTPVKGVASVRTVLGVPALVIERNEGGPAVVDLVLEGMRVKLYAVYSEMEADALIKIAETLLRSAQ